MYFSSHILGGINLELLIISLHWKQWLIENYTSKMPLKDGNINFRNNNIFSISFDDVKILEKKLKLKVKKLFPSYFIIRIICM